MKNKKKIFMKKEKYGKSSRKIKEKCAKYCMTITMYDVCPVVLLGGLLHYIVCDPLNCLVE